MVAIQGKIRALFSCDLIFQFQNENPSDTMLTHFKIIFGLFHFLSSLNFFGCKVHDFIFENPYNAVWFNISSVFFFPQSDVGSAGQQRQVDEAYGTMGSNNGNNTLGSNISTGSGSSSSVVTVIAAPNTDDGRLDLYCKPLPF